MQFIKATVRAAVHIWEQTESQTPPAPDAQAPRGTAQEDVCGASYKPNRPPPRDPATTLLDITQMTKI